MKTVNVLKPFVFNRPPVAGQKLPLSVTFKPGFQKIPDDIASHPWVAEHYADGCIESPAQAKVRTRLINEKAKAAKVEADVATAQAHETMARLERTAPVSAKIADLSAEALHTPLNKLRAKQGEGLVASSARKS